MSKFIYLLFFIPVISYGQEINSKIELPKDQILEVISMDQTAELAKTDSNKLQIVIYPAMQAITEEAYLEYKRLELDSISNQVMDKKDSKQ